MASRHPAVRDVFRADRSSMVVLSRVGVTIGDAASRMSAVTPLLDRICRTGALIGILTTGTNHPSYQNGRWVPLAERDLCAGGHVKSKKFAGETAKQSFPAERACLPHRIVIYKPSLGTAFRRQFGRHRLQPPPKVVPTPLARTRAASARGETADIPTRREPVGRCRRGRRRFRCNRPIAAPLARTATRKPDRQEATGQASGRSTDRSGAHAIRLDKAIPGNRETIPRSQKIGAAASRNIRNNRQSLPSLPLSYLVTFSGSAVSSETSAASSPSASARSTILPGLRPDCTTTNPRP